MSFRQCFACGCKLTSDTGFVKVWMGDGYALVCLACVRRLNLPAGMYTV
jgi:hypothetical protein